MQGSTVLPRACGDDPSKLGAAAVPLLVLPAHAGMIPPIAARLPGDLLCSPRMRG